MDHLKILSNFTFGRVDAETDDKLVNCFIGTEILKYAISTQHTLLLGGKGSGKSALFRILCEEANRLSQFISVSFKELFRIPAFGLNSDEYLSYSEIKEINPQSINDFKYFWQLYFCLKASYVILNSSYIRQLYKKSSSPSLLANYSYLYQLMRSIGLLTENQQRKTNIISRIKSYFYAIKISNQNSQNSKINLNVNNILDKIDKILKETNSYAWILVDQIDLLYLDDLPKRNRAISALIQLIIEYSNRYTNLNLKIFLRTDIFKGLNIVNKSHLVSSSVELVWTEELILKMLLARAIYDNSVKLFCEHNLKEHIDVSKIISGNYDLLIRVFYTIFQPSNNSKIKLHQWMIKHLTDGLGKIYPREFIHLANQSVSVQKELLRAQNNCYNYLISEKAIKIAFKSVSKYRCDSYLYAEYPHLVEHFNKLKEYGYDTLSKEEFENLFAGMNPSGKDALLILYDTGLLQPLKNKTIQGSSKYKVVDLYKHGFGLSTKRKN